MASSDPSASQSLSALAKFGFTELDLAIEQLTKLVDLVGDVGRSALAHLSNAADPDQALRLLVRLAEAQAPAVKKILKKES